MNPDPMNPLGYLFAAFLVVWLVFFIYAALLARRQSKLRADIEALKKEMAEKKRETR